MTYDPVPFHVIQLIKPVLLLCLVAGIVLFLISLAWRGRNRIEGDRFSLGHTMLTCPHCQRETIAGRPKCEH